MTTTVDAIYEQGVLRPAQPIALPEGARVQVIVIAGRTGAAAPSPAEILAEIAALPVGGPADGFAGRDHDRLLYGGREGRRSPP
ncbi:MAG: antitoxin family protein [Armatimonadetes bacterium]|nr:antitoxin family protein [Armatimonadota bacterium]